MFYVSRGPVRGKLLQAYQIAYDDISQSGGFDKEDVGLLARLIGFVAADGTKLTEEEKGRWLETGILELKDTHGKEHKYPRIVLPWVNDEEDERVHETIAWLNNYDATFMISLFHDEIRYHINSEGQYIWTATDKGRAKVGEA